MTLTKVRGDVEFLGTVTGVGGGLTSESTGNIVLWVNPSTGSDTPTPTRPARVTSGDFMAEPFATVEAAVSTLPDLIRYETRLKLSADSHGEILLYGKIIGGIDTEPAMLIIEPDDSPTYADYTPTAGLATGTIASGDRNQVVVTGAGWVPGELTGRAIEFAGSTFGILGNSADTLDLTGLDYSWVVPATEAFTLKDWLVKVSFIGTYNIRGRVETYRLKTLDTGWDAERCSNLYIEECSLNGGCRFIDCGSLEFQMVITSDDGRGSFELIRVSSLYASLGCSSYNGFSLSNCHNLQFSELTVIGDGLRITDGSDILIRGLVNRCYGASGPSIENSSNVNISGQFGTFIDEARFGGVRVGDNSYVSLGGDLAGSVTDGCGLYLYGIGSTVNLWVAPNPTLTGDDGDVRLGASGDILTWSDAIDVDGYERGVEDLVSGSKTYAPMRI